MMSRRRRALVLTLLALAVPLPAYAITTEVLAPSSPSSISVSASLGKCGVLDDGVACQINVSFSEVSNAASYTAAVTRADGSVVDYGTVSPGGTSIWVPYVGAGTYSVKITAYGEPETPAEDAAGHGGVIATGYSNGEQADGDRTASRGDRGEVAAEAGTRDPGAAVNSDPDGAASTQATDSQGAPETSTPAEESTTEETTTCAPAAPLAAPTPPSEPPADLDPENPDEDADGIGDEQERATYEQQLAEYQAAVAAQASPDC
jgi:hypothetical protein